MEDKPIKRINSRIAWECPWYRVRQDDILLPNGRYGVYNVVEKPTAVWVVPVTSDGRLVLIRTYRYTVEDWCWELPAGSIEPDQTPEEAARAELLQEVGGTAQKLHYLNWYYTANGICNEVSHFFLATGVTLSAPAHEPAEVIQVHTLPIPEVLHMATNHQITDAPSVMILLLCAEQLKALAQSHTSPMIKNAES